MHIMKLAREKKIFTFYLYELDRPIPDSQYLVSDQVRHMHSGNKCQGNTYDVFVNGEWVCISKVMAQHERHLSE